MKKNPIKKSRSKRTLLPLLLTILLFSFMVLSAVIVQTTTNIGSSASSVRPSPTPPILRCNDSCINPAVLGYDQCTRSNPNYFCTLVPAGPSQRYGCRLRTNPTSNTCQPGSPIPSGSPGTSPSPRPTITPTPRPSGSPMPYPTSTPSPMP